MIVNSTDANPIHPNTKAKYIGRVYGQMEILAVTHRDPKNPHHYWVSAKCSCGTIKPVRLSGLQSGGIKSCGCVGKAARAAANTGNTRARIAFGENAKNTLYKNYVRYAAERNLEFALSLNEFLDITAQKCFYCDVEPYHVKAPKHAHGAYVYNGVDRVDNSIGYIASNCVAACRPCNSAKNAVTKQMVFKLFHRLFPRTPPALLPGAPQDP